MYSPGSCLSMVLASLTLLAQPMVLLFSIYYTSFYASCCLLNVLQYKKPKILLELEKELQIELKKLKSEREGDVECSQS